MTDSKVMKLRKEKKVCKGERRWRDKYVEQENEESRLGWLRCVVGSIIDTVYRKWY